MTFKNLTEYTSYLKGLSSFELLIIEHQLRISDPKHQIVLNELSQRGYNTQDLSYKGIWSNYAKIINAEYSENKSPMTGKITIRYNSWTILIFSEFDEFDEGNTFQTNSYTTFQCEYLQNEYFTFRLFWNPFLKKIFKLVKYNSFDIKNSLINNNVVIMSNKKELMSKLLEDPEIIDQLQILNNSFHSTFSLKRNYEIENKSSYLLKYRTRDILIDYTQMNKVILLIFSTLRNLSYFHNN